MSCSRPKMRAPETCLSSGFQAGQAFRAPWTGDQWVPMASASRTLFLEPPASEPTCCPVRVTKRACENPGPPRFQSFGRLKTARLALGTRRAPERRGAAECPIQGEGIRRPGCQTLAAAPLGWLRATGPWPMRVPRRR